MDIVQTNKFSALDISINNHSEADSEYLGQRVWGVVAAAAAAATTAAEAEAAAQQQQQQQQQL